MGGQYTIERILGAGAYATVCLARHVDGRQVALKVLKKDHLNDHDVLSRMTDEGQLMRRLHHPNVVRVFQIHDYDGRVVIEMEAVHGASLDKLLERTHNGLPAPIAIEIARQVAVALDAMYHGAHKLKVIHRDVKPSNVLMSTEGHIKVVDFGIAKGDFDERQAKSLYVVPGSMGFEAPERRGSRRPTTDATPAIDVYGLGVTLFVLATGRTLIVSAKPADHDDDVARNVGHVKVEGVPNKAMRRLLVDVLRHDPSARPSMRELVARLGQLVDAAGGPPDLAAYAREWIAPIAAQNAEDPRAHPAWDDVSFLQTERPTGQPEPLTPEALDRELRVFLAKPGWETRIAELRRLLQRCPTFVDSPFLEVLDRAHRPWFAIWQAPPPSPAELEAALMVLCDHVSPKVRSRAQRLLEHPDERVSVAARFLLRG